jgi:hypothetical protein
MAVGITVLSEVLQDVFPNEDRILINGHPLVTCYDLPKQLLRLL